MDALEKGVHFQDEENREDYLKALEICLPHLHEAITRTVDPQKPPFDNTVENLKQNVILLEKQEPYQGKPLEALKRLLNNSSTENREGLAKALIDSGCTDPESTKQILSSWVRPACRSTEPLEKKSLGTGNPGTAR